MKFCALKLVMNPTERSGNSRMLEREFTLLVPAKGEILRQSAHSALVGNLKLR
jgi:hypothetical protein